MRFFRGMLRRALGLLGTLASTLLGLTTLGPGCGGEAPDQAAIRPASAPALKADGPDLADRDCRVVLRRAARVSGPTGPLVHQGPDGESWWVWEAIVDLSEELVSAGARPVVLFAPWGGPEWYEAAQADEIAGAEEGFRRYRILLTEHTISPSHVSTTGLSQFVLEMVPAALLPDGTRLFDHNRNPGDLDNYRLDSSNGFSVPEAPGVCASEPRAIAEVHFLGGWRQVQRGPIVQGGLVRVSYSPVRLEGCPNGGDEGWHAELWARFEPSGQSARWDLKVLERDPSGRPLRLAPIEVRIPAGATWVEFWAHAWNEQGCETWDSRYGENYGFRVLAEPPEAVRWAGDWGSALTRSCEWQPGVPEPLVVTEYDIERSCLDVTADVYVPGLTDAEEQHPELLLARVSYTRDGGETETQTLEFVSRVGNNYRFVWHLPRSEMTSVPWHAYTYFFEFSTNGLDWFRVGQDPGPDATRPRTVERAFHVPGWQD